MLHNQKNPSPASSIISSLNTGDKVTYRIFKQGNPTPQTGEITATNGSITLPKLGNDILQEKIAYNLEIERENSNANILIEYDPKDRSYKLSGSSFDSFQPMSYSINGTTKRSKSDWSGLFEESGFIETPKGSANDISLAFNSINLTDGVEMSPLLVKVSITLGELQDIDVETPFIRKNFIKPMMMAAEQITATMYQYIFMIGTMIDADTQMDTQREIQKLQAEAHNDYHPSEQMCVVGTFSRSLHNAQSHANFNKMAFSQIMMNAYTNKKGSSIKYDARARIRVFQENYCNRADHNQGLNPMCETAPPKKERLNKDVNFALTALRPLTLNVDFTDTPEEEDETDLINLARNLYWVQPISDVAKDEIKKKAQAHLGARRVIAMNNVAQLSFAALVGQKAKAFESGQNGNGGEYMKKLIEMMLKDGAPKPTPEDILGEDPSYYAMMDVLTKKMYQEPSFYTNLYDKPANVERIKTSMRAIQMMHDRDRYEASLRREMLSSLILENALMKEHNIAEDKLRAALK